MKIVENNVKCGEVMIFSQKFYLKNLQTIIQIFSQRWGFFISSKILSDKPTYERRRFWFQKGTILGITFL